MKNCFNMKQFEISIFQTDITPFPLPHIINTCRELGAFPTSCGLLFIGQRPSCEKKKSNRHDEH